MCMCAYNELERKARVDRGVMHNAVVKKGEDGLMCAIRKGCHED